MDSPMVSERPQGLPDRKHRRLNLKQREIVELYLTGVPVVEISELTGYSIPGVYQLLRSDVAVLHKQQVMRAYDEEFEMLFPKVVKAIRDHLDGSDEGLRADACKTWLKAHGRFVNRDDGEGKFNITAEEVVFQMLNHDAGRVDKKTEG